MEGQIPKTMKGVRVHKTGEPIRVEEIEVPTPKADEILIKVGASPINPSDVNFTKGKYPTDKVWPVVAGFEGSGTVVAHGGNEKGKELVGKRVAFFPNGNNGTWSEYSIAKIDSIWVLPERLDFIQGACSFINPLSALAMLEYIKQGKHKTVINTAGNSSLGHMMIRLFRKSGIEIISIVRKDEQIKELKKEFGDDLVALNSQTQDFLPTLKEIATKLNATLCFEAIGGEFTAQVLNQMPRFSEVFIYGRLSGQRAQLEQGDMIFGQKRVRGFWLFAYLDTLTSEERAKFFYSLNDHFTDAFLSTIYKTYKFDDVYEAIKDAEENASKGKVILLPN